MKRTSWPGALFASLLAAIVVVTAACSGSASKSASSSATAPEPAGASAAASPPASPSTGGATSGGIGTTVGPAQPQIVRTGDVHLTVGAGLIPRSFDQIAGLVTAAGGFVSDSDMSTGNVPSARLVLRVANDRLTTIVNQLASIGRISQQTLQGQDVTGQVVDLTARVTVLQSEEDAVRTLLSRASAIGDILQIQGQLFTLQTQIEQMDGQRASLADQTTWATLSVEISESSGAVKPGAAPKRHPSTASRAWGLARDNTVAVIRGLAIGAGWAAPGLLLALLLGLPLAIWYRGRRRAAAQ